MYDLIIIGAGPAGLTAAIYSARYNLKTLVIGEVAGGQVAEVGLIENYPGFESISGLELVKKWYDHAKNLGAEIISDCADYCIEKNSKEGKIFEVKTLGGREFTARTVLLASGTEPRRLNVPGEKEFFGKGVTYCFICDAPFFRNKTTIVIGGGDAAFTGALVLSDIASKVYLAHRRKEFSAKPGFIDELKKRDNVEFILDAAVSEIRGTNKVEDITFNILGKERVVKTDGIFVEIGSVPTRKVSQQLGISVTQAGFVEVKADQSTSVEGIWAAGDLTTGSNGVRQIVCAMSEGAVATHSIFKYLRGGTRTPVY